MLQSPVVVAERVAGDTESPLGGHKIDELLGVNPLTGERIDAKGGDVPPQGIIFHPYKNGEIHFFGIGFRHFFEPHAVVVGDADTVQAFGFGIADDLRQGHFAVGGIG